VAETDASSAAPEAPPQETPAPSATVLTVAQLREIGLFGALSDEALEALGKELRTRWIAPGVVVMREGENAREMYVVVSGEMEVLRRSRRGTEGRVAVLGPGNWVGEMSILDAQPRSATVRALGPTLLLTITAEDLDRLYRRDVKSFLMLLLNVNRELSRRLRVADGMIAGFLTAMWDDNLGFSRTRAPDDGGQ